MSVCQIEGCEKPRNCRGWCQMHYTRWRAHGDPLTLRPNMPPPLKRFMAKVDHADTGCWLWCPGVAVESGYGNFWLNGTTELAHRASYTLFKGPIPDGLVVDHLCKVRLCVNPDHLEAVTQRENLLRSDTFQARNAAKTHCVHGHEFTPENTATTKGHRRCLTCERERARLRRERRAA